MKLEKLLSLERKNSPQECLSILKRYGHLGRSADLSNLTEDLKNGWISTEELEALCVRIDNAKRSPQSKDVSPADIHQAVKYGLKNLANIEILGAGFPSGAIMQDFDFRGSRLYGCSFQSNDLSGARFRGANLRNVSFRRSVLNRSDFSGISIRGEKVDMDSGEIVLTDSEPWHIETRYSGSVDICSDCELLYRKVLGIGGHGTRSGCVFFQEGMPLGIMKLTGAKSFLAMRTVRNQNGDVVFWKGMVYALPRSLSRFLDEKSFTEKIPLRTWGRTDVEKLAQDKAFQPLNKSYSYFVRNNMRFVNDPRIFTALTALTEKIEAGQEPMVDILSEQRHRAQV